MRKGLFLAFEGIDGSGKSTQIRLLNDRLLKEGCRVYQTCEPSGGPIGSQIRQILTGRMKADSRVIAALFAADRLDHLLNDINGMAARIEEGITVLTDRYYFSSYAYHSVDVPMDWVIAANEERRGYDGFFVGRNYGSDLAAGRHVCSRPGAYLAGGEEAV